VFVASPAATADKVFLLRHRGEIVCLDPETGKTIWTGSLPEHRTPYYASPVIANGVLYAAREDGQLFSAAVGESFQLLGELSLGERIVATPVPSNDRLLVRGDDHLFCLVEAPVR
jgi:outer membrane protein assembly factor BamB